MNSAEKTKEKRIKEEFERISDFFKTLPENEKQFVSPLLQNAAFMKVTLEDLQKTILEQGCVESYQNGANQKGMKQSAALQSFNQLIKNYASVQKTLSQILPPERKPELPPVIQGKTLMYWQFEKREEEKEDTDIIFEPFEDWLKRKLKEEPEHDYETESFDEWLEKKEDTNEEE